MSEIPQCNKIYIYILLKIYIEDNSKNSATPKFSFKFFARQRNF